jgi:hypothetical protein
VAAGNGDPRLPPRGRSRTNAISKLFRCALGYRVRAGIHVIEDFDCLCHANRILELVPGPSIA